MSMQWLGFRNEAMRNQEKESVLEETDRNKSVKNDQVNANSRRFKSQVCRSDCSKAHLLSWFDSFMFGF